MRILGLDLSLRSTGYVLLDEEYVVWYGALGDDNPGVERLAMFDAWIREAIAIATLWGRVDTMWRPGPPIDHVAIEGYSFDSRFQGQALGELGGVIKLAIHQARVPMTMIPPSVWKKTLCGNGLLKKDLVRLELYKRYGVEFAKQDTLDAWAVAMTLRRQLLGLDKPEPKSRRRTKDLPHIPAQEAAVGEQVPPVPR